MGDDEPRRGRTEGPTQKKSADTNDTKKSEKCSDSWFDFLCRFQRSESSDDATALLRDSSIPFPEVPEDKFWDKDYEKLAKNHGEVTLEKGVVIKRDGILTYYKVQDGDTVWGIKNKLSKYKEFSYLKDEGTGQGSFNVPSKLLRADIYFPLPVKREHREVSDEKFVNYCHEALQEMKVNKDYGPQIMQMIAASSEKEVIATMLSVAKMECGGKPLGRFSFHRWENHISAFSYSYFHIIYKDDTAGYKACQKLGLTPGKLLHPRNAGKAFLAFLIEKTKNPQELFPLYSGGTVKNLENIDRNDPSLTRFADIYNGKWRTGNPDYTLKLGIYYQKSLAFMNHEKVDYSDTPKMPFVPCTGKSSKARSPEKVLKSDFVNILEDANHIYTLIYGPKNMPLKSRPQYDKFSSSLFSAFKQFGLDLSIRPEDSNGRGGDLLRIVFDKKGKPLIEFHRQVPGQNKKFSVDEDGRVV